MEKTVAVFVAINFIVIGISHITQQSAWKEFFAMLHSKGRAGAFANGFLAIAMGSVIVSTHNIWSGIPVVLTIIGWAYLVKATAIFVFPDWNVRSLESVQSATTIKFAIAGIAMLIIAALLCIAVLQGCYSE